MGNIIILGAGGLAREINDIIEAALKAVPGPGPDRLWGYVVDKGCGQVGSLVAGKPILGDFEWLAGQDAADLKVICGVGSPELRARFAGKVTGEWYRAVHPLSAVSPWACLAKGVVISAGCVVGNQASLGQHVILNRLSSVGHDSTLEDFVTVSPGANIAGNVKVETGCYIGIGSTLIEGITIGKGSLVAAGSVVTRNIPPFSTAAGNPARVIRTRPPGDINE